MSYKIVHLSSVHSAHDIRIFFKECRTLAQAGYEVVYIVPHDKDEFQDKVKIKAVPKTKGRLKRMLFTVWNVYKAAIRENADLYHFHDPELIPIGIMLKICKKKVIYDVHEDLPKQIISKHWIPKKLRKPVSFCIEKIENLAAGTFTAIVTATPFIGERFIKYNSNTVIINNFPLQCEFPEYNSDWSKKERAVCYVGGLSPIRGLYEMVHAISKLDNVKLFLAGSYSPSSCRNEAEKLPGWPKVYDLGFLNRNEVINVMNKSMAGLVILHPVPNYVDSLPIKMFEYMLAGIPVIASNFPLWKKIIEENKCGICVDPLNIDMIAKAIQWLIDNPEIAKQLGENGRKAVKEYFNWESESIKLIELYDFIFVKHKGINISS